MGTKDSQQRGKKYFGWWLYSKRKPAKKIKWSFQNIKRKKEMFLRNLQNQDFFL